MLKKSSYKIRTFFLQEFAKELILNSKKGIEIPGLDIKKEIIRPAAEKEFSTSFKLGKEYTPSVFDSKDKFPNMKPTLKPLQLLKHSHPMPTSKHLEIITEVPLKPPVPGEVDLGKLNAFIYNREISIIECPGPGKIISVKKAVDINLTQITLSPEEINQIIQGFSEKSRIPIIGGIFKASVGSLTITAVISEFVGSRFIIYRPTPYNLIGTQNQQTG